ASQCPIGTTPITFQSGWNLLDDVVSPRSESAGLARLGPTVASLARDERSWALLDNSTPLLLATDAIVHQVPQTLVDSIAATPGLENYESFLGMLDTPEAWMPYVALVATPEVRAGLETTEAPEGGPLPYLSRLVIDGTLDDLMRTLSLAAELLSGEPVTHP
ncbi:MAG: hypothetical protein CL927_06390, partial [Deltaproteobacteria bacterium]|nr:hypothetical protein [Deltaproteobacteria bacterium]HCH66144.1 hypothetical protein [Deltaproteobacteria bacterium]